jgi:hypothetical protein
MINVDVAMDDKMQLVNVFSNPDLKTLYQNTFAEEETEDPAIVDDEEKDNKDKHEMYDNIPVHPTVAALGMPMPMARNVNAHIYPPNRDDLNYALRLQMVAAADAYLDANAIIEMPETYSDLPLRHDTNHRRRRHPLSLPFQRHPSQPPPPPGDPPISEAAAAVIHKPATETDTVAEIETERQGPPTAATIPTVNSLAMEQIRRSSRRKVVRMLWHVLVMSIGMLGYIIVTATSPISEFWLTTPIQTVIRDFAMMASLVVLQAAQVAAF